MPVGIDKIIIKNFKAFPEEEIINLNGKHLLVYGENGSGKSSIYWALYTLFQAKDKGKEKTEKYFNKAHPENLLNVFNQNEESYVKISLTTEPNVFYVLDKNGVHIEGTSTNSDDVQNLSLIEITKELNKIKRGRLFHKNNENMNFVLNKSDGAYFSVRMKSAEQIVLLEEEGKPERISIFSKCKVSGTDNNGIITNETEQFNTIKECYVEMCSRFEIDPLDELSRIFDFDGKNFDEKLIEINGR